MEASASDGAGPPTRTMRRRSLSLHSSNELSITQGFPDLADLTGPATASPSTSSSLSTGDSSSSSEGDGSSDEGKTAKAAKSKPPKVSRRTKDILVNLQPDVPIPDIIDELADERKLAEKYGLAPPRPHTEPAHTLPHTHTPAAAAQEESEEVCVRAEDKKGKKKSKTEQKFDYVVKLLLLGDSGVGKTSLMTRFAEKHFEPSLLSTAGVDFKTKYVHVLGKIVKCQIWDTAGQERFHVITQAYYRGAQGIILVYDVSDPTETSFSNVRYWMDRIKCHASDETKKILIGNKTDVPGRKIDSSRGKATAKEYGIPFFETSAKNDTNVSKAFNSMLKEVVGKMIEAGVPAHVPPTGHVPIAEIKPPEPHGGDGSGRKCVVM